jgi:hypothetical protein
VSDDLQVSKSATQYIAVTGSPCHLLCSFFIDCESNACVVLLWTWLLFYRMCRLKCNGYVPRNRYNVRCFLPWNGTHAQHPCGVWINVKITLSRYIVFRRSGVGVACGLFYVALVSEL